MNLAAGDLPVRGPGIECGGFDSQLFSEFFDRQQHRDTNWGSLTTPLSPHDTPVSDSECTPSGCKLALQSSGQAFRVPLQACPPRDRHPAFFFDAPPLACEGWS
jgi:hypothetical protein